MAKVHTFVVERGSERLPLEFTAATKREAVDKLYKHLAAAGIVADKALYTGVKTGSVAATDLNLSVLRNRLAGGRDARMGATATSFPNQLEATAIPHLRRCMQAGLCEPKGHKIVLTPAGMAALGIRND